MRTGFCIDLSEETLFRMLRERTKDYPSDSKVLGVRWMPWTRSIRVFVDSAQGVEVAEGEEFHRFELTERVER